MSRHTQHYYLPFSRTTAWILGYSSEMECLPWAQSPAQAKTNSLQKQLLPFKQKWGDLSSAQCSMWPVDICGMVGKGLLVYRDAQRSFQGYRDVWCETDTLIESEGERILCDISPCYRCTPSILYSLYLPSLTSILRTPTALPPCSLTSWVLVPWDQAGASG